jgi:hypothetical protein
LAPSVEAPQTDLAAGHKAEQEDQHRVLGGQAALGLHPAPELLVEPFNHVCDSEPLPLALGELEEPEQLLAALPEAPDHTGTAGRPLALEGRVGSPGGRGP